jgi:Mor family transcriptional regulator
MSDRIGEPVKYNNRWPELLMDICEHSTAILTDMGGLDPKQAKDLGNAIAVKMANLWGGQMIYFPKGAWMELARRDLEIYREFDGTNRAALMKKYNVSRTRLYEIVNAVRQELYRHRLDLRAAEKIPP